VQRLIFNEIAKTAVFFAGVLVYLHLNFASAQALPVAHYNAVELKRESARSVQLVFALNLPQMFHALLAPQLGYPAFLQRYADMPDAALDKEIAKADAALSSKAYFTLPSGAKVNITRWQWPDKQALRDGFKASLILLNMPPNPASHLDPVRVLAQVQAKIPINRAQLQLPPSLYPIVVSLPHDKFWLTELIPVAIVDLP
jgi:hypothetical protein